MPVVIRARDIPAQPWRNGGGRTRELLTRPASAGEWRLRISLAEVDREGPFSSFPGITRWFSVLEGAGVRLTIGASEQVLRPGHEPITFSGELPVLCTLIDGPTTDLNLMYVSGIGLMCKATAGVPWSSPLPQRGLFTRIAGVWQAQGMAPLRLPEHCLLWHEQAGDVAFTFSPDEAGAFPALWLGFQP